MKFHADTTHRLQIDSAGQGWLQIKGVRYTQPVILQADGQIQVWEVENFAQLQAEHFAPIVQSQPEVVLFGTGQRQRFAHPATLATLMQARIGVETMTTQAACRTFNILSSEGRKVIAALLFDE